MSIGKVFRKSVAGLSEDAAFSVRDLRRLDRAIRDARLAWTTPVSALLTPAAPGSRAAVLTERECAFDHCAVLLFPRTLAAGLRDLRRRGLDPLPATPSTVVRRRLSERYGLDPGTCEVTITRLRLELPDGRRHAAVEVFLLPRDSSGFAPRVEEPEAAYGFENHTAFVLGRVAPAPPAALVDAWRAEAGLLWEGGGHNPHEGGPQGSTVLYFVRDHLDPARPRRVELHCAGDLSSFTDALPKETEAVERAYRRWAGNGTHLPA